jgi:HK97 family phage portal protein
MNFITRLLKKPEKRSIGEDWQWPWLWNALRGSMSKSGVNVTPETALTSTVVFACVRVLAESVASLPLIIYRKRPDGGKDAVSDFYLYPLLHDSPNSYQTSYDFREMQMGHLALRGNCFSYKVMQRDGKIAELIPLNPASMQVQVKDGAILYLYTHPDGIQEKYPADKIWHIKGLSSDGYIGLSPITLARDAIGLSLTAQDHGSRFWDNAARPGGVLEIPGRLSEDAAKRLKDSWQESYTGANSGKVALLEEGLTWKAVGMTNEDSQYLQSREFQVEEICRIFRVPCVLVNHSDKSSTYASAEQFFLSFVVHTIRPWLVRIEQSINKYLFTEAERKQGYFAEFKVDGLLRGDIASRYNAYAIARQNKWMNANEIRALENMNPIEGGEVYENPNIDLNKDKNSDTQDEETKQNNSVEISELRDEMNNGLREITGKLEAQQPEINISPAPVTVNLTNDLSKVKTKRTVKFKRDKDGELKQADIIEELEDGNNTGTL